MSFNKTSLKQLEAIFREAFQALTWKSTIYFQSHLSALQSLVGSCDNYSTWILNRMDHTSGRKLQNMDRMLQKYGENLHTVRARLAEPLCPLLRLRGGGFQVDVMPEDDFLENPPLWYVQHVTAIPYQISQSENRLYSVIYRMNRHLALNSHTIVQMGMLLNLMYANARMSIRERDRIQVRYQIHYRNEDGHLTASFVGSTIEEVQAKLEGLMDMPMGSSIQTPIVYRIQILLDRQAVSGGCNSETVRHKQYKIKMFQGEVQRWKLSTVNPKSSQENCLLACLKRFTKDKRSLDTIRELIHHPGKIRYNSPVMGILSDLYQVRIEVYIHEGAYVRLGHTEGSKDRVCQVLLLPTEHYVLITEWKSLPAPEPIPRSWVKYAPVERERPLDINQVVFYDLETLLVRRIHTAYACGFARGREEVRILEGPHCLEAFVDHWNQWKGSDLTLVAHNGSRFDDILFLHLLEDRGIPVDFISSNGRILKLQWRNEHGVTFTHWDSCQFLLCSLKDAALSFGCKYLKGDFDHTLIQSFDDVGKYKHGKDGWAPYLQLDVEVLREIFMQFSDRMFRLFQVHITEFVTLSNLAESVWKMTLKNSGLELDIPQGEKYEFIRNSVYGARVYPLQKEFKSEMMEDIEPDNPILNQMIYEQMKQSGDYLYNADVCSLYPHAMRECVFPVGESTWVEGDIAKQVFDMGMEGFYEIQFRCPKDIRYPILERRKLEYSDLPSERKRWRSSGLEHSLQDGKGVYPALSIRTAIRYGYQVSFVRGLIYPQKKKHVFQKYIDQVFRMKKYQDALESKSDLTEFEDLKSYGSTYDPVMRHCCKILMNALFGKMCQKPNQTKTQIVKTYDDYVSFQNDHEITGWYEMHKTIGDQVETHLILSGEPEVVENTKPVQLGSYILSYSKCYMLDLFSLITHGLKEIGFTYTDTDSMHVFGKHWDFLKSKGVTGDHLGLLNNDIKKAKDAIIYYEKTLAPKMYLYKWIDADGKLGTVMKTKGIPRHRLKESWFHREVGEEIEIENPFKRTLVPKPHEQRNNIPEFCVRKEIQWRTFNGKKIKDQIVATHWNGMELKENQWYPKGYQNA